MPSPRPFPELPFPDPRAAGEAGSLAVGPPAAGALAEGTAAGADDDVPSGGGAAAAAVDADGLGSAEPVGSSADGDGDTAGLAVSPDEERVSARPPGLPCRSPAVVPKRDSPAGQRHRPGRAGHGQHAPRRAAAGAPRGTAAVRAASRLPLGRGDPGQLGRLVVGVLPPVGGRRIGVPLVRRRIGRGGRVVHDRPHRRRTTLTWPEHAGDCRDRSDSWDSYRR
ncbi:hypothetical protein Saso_73520 [Streptomyces asoensis]|uniref:Uncharacterized protein n=1 Tax=Streptomyces asoensis TaxID=249586 RepID=A0ABQ3SCN6_9ACTN|nr:hypothetical protein GCM10010496_22430 [Streptomyces asoensis]GHI65702.1 hypothetical protein Saso_73520 [Streptomyces asoensis]